MVESHPGVYFPPRYGRDGHGLEKNRSSPADGESGFFPQFFCQCPAAGVYIARAEADDYIGIHRSHLFGQLRTVADRQGTVSRRPIISDSTPGIGSSRAG